MREGLGHMYEGAKRMGLGLEEIGRGLLNVKQHKLVQGGRQMTRGGHRMACGFLQTSLGVKICAPHLQRKVSDFSRCMSDCKARHVGTSVRVLVQHGQCIHSCAKAKDANAAENTEHVRWQRRTWTA